MRSEVFFSCTNWEPAKRNVSLASILSFGLFDVVCYIFYSLRKSIWAFIVVWNVAVHRRDQVYALFLHKDFGWFFQHLLHLVNDLLPLIHDFDDLFAGSFLRNQLAKNAQCRLFVLFWCVFFIGFLYFCVNHACFSFFLLLCLFRLLRIFLSGDSFALLSVAYMLNARVNNFRCSLSDELAIVLTGFENL